MDYGGMAVTRVTLRGLIDHVLGFSLEPNQRLNRYSYPVYFESLCKTYLRSQPPALSHWTRFSTLNFDGLIVYNYHKGPEGNEFEACTGYATPEDVKNWKTAIKCLQRYCLNLLLDPDRQDFYQINFSTGYYQYNIAKNFKGAVKILEAMGYVVTASDRTKITPMKMCLKEPKNLRNHDHRVRLARVLVDLVLFDFELDTLVQCINEYCRRMKPGCYCTIMDAWEARKNTSGGVESVLGYLYNNLDKPHMADNVTERTLLGIKGILPSDHEEFESVTQHINPSSYNDDDDNQLIMDSTLLGYRDPPVARSQVKPTIQSRADPARYYPITAGYRPPDWLPPSNPVLIPAVSTINQSISKTFQACASPDSRYGKTNLNFLKKKLQHHKEVTDIVAQCSDAVPYSQSTSGYTTPGSDSTVAKKTDLASLRSRLEKSKEVREKVVSADIYNLTELATYKNPYNKNPVVGPRTVTPANLASDNTHSAMSTSSLKKFYKLWQCAQCQTLNEAHHISCNYCKVYLGGMADTSIICDFCQLMFSAQKSGHTDTHMRCPRCKQVCETALPL